MKQTIRRFLTGGSSRQGTYAAGVTAVVIAIVIVLNLIVGQLPSNLREIDLTDNRLYTVSDTSADYLKGLSRDVEILVVAEHGSIDERIAKFLDRYAALSDRITVTELDPVSNPSVLTTYNTSADTLVVRCAETGKQTTVAFSEIIVQDLYSYYMTGNYSETEFDAEGQITSAVDYVVRDSSDKVYTLEGHGEASLPSSAAGLIDKANLLTGSLNLLTAGSVPEDCDLLICYAPAKDLADDELVMLRNYLAGGGSFFLLTDADGLANFNTLMAEYGMTVVSGYIADAANYYRSPYYILPTLSGSCDLTSGLSDDAMALIINARGMILTGPARDTITVSSFLATSDKGYAVTDSNQTQGVYVLGATSVETLGENGEDTARFTVVTASSLIDASITDSFPNLSNLDIFMNAVTADLEDAGNSSIAAKSLEITYNTVRNAGLWSVLFIIVIPLAVLVGGFLFWLKRRKL